MSVLYRKGKAYGTSITGVGIESVEQTITKEGSGEINEITVTKTDHSTHIFEVRNGRRGEIGHTALEVNVMYGGIYTTGEKSLLTVDNFNRTPQVDEVVQEDGIEINIAGDYFYIIDNKPQICWCKVTDVIDSNVEFEVLDTKLVASIVAVEASVDENVGIPAVATTLENETGENILKFDFTNMKGDPGEIEAVNVNITTTDTEADPTCTVELGGTPEKREITLNFNNIKGKRGDQVLRIPSVKPTTVVNGDIWLS